MGLVCFSLVARVLSAAHPAADTVFFVFVMPGLLASLIGSSGLGVVLLRRRYPARGAAWLLALAIPLWLFANMVIGHNSFGLLPIMWAWALAPIRPRPASVKPLVNRQPNRGRGRS